MAQFDSLPERFGLRGSLSCASSSLRSRDGSQASIANRSRSSAVSELKAVSSNSPDFGITAAGLSGVLDMTVGFGSKPWG